MEGIELISFQIISAVGTARSMYIEAIQLAKDGKISEAEAMMEEGQKVFVEGHHAHASLIQKEAAGEKTEFALLLMHAEDQLMGAEMLKLVIMELIELHKDK